MKFGNKLVKITVTLKSYATIDLELSGKTRLGQLFLTVRDVRSGEAGEAVPHLQNCAKENENKVYN